MVLENYHGNPNSLCSLWFIIIRTCKKNKCEFKTKLGEIPFQQ